MSEKIEVHQDELGMWLSCDGYMVVRTDLPHGPYPLDKAVIESSQHLPPVWLWRGPWLRLV